jgi:hypothetical protein
LKDIAHEPAVLREIVHEPEYTQAVTRLFQSLRRADEILDGLEFFVSRRAELGMAVRGYPSDEFASWLSKPVPGKGRVRVLYHYGPETVTMLSAWIVPEELEGKFSR